MQKQRSNLSLARLWEVAGEEDPLLPEKKALYYPREQNPESDFWDGGQIHTLRNAGSVAAYFIEKSMALILS